MNNITVDKHDLVEKLKANRDGHRKIFEEALQGYRRSVITTLEEQLQRARDGKRIDSYIQFPQPEDHTTDYDRVIQMLEWTQDLSVELSERDFQSYVMDNWGWQEQFLTANAMYSGIAQRKIDESVPGRGY